MYSAESVSLNKCTYCVCSYKCRCWLHVLQFLFLKVSLGLNLCTDGQSSLFLWLVIYIKSAFNADVARYSTEILVPFPTGGFFHERILSAISWFTAWLRASTLSRWLSAAAQLFATRFANDGSLERCTLFVNCASRNMKAGILDGKEVGRRKTQQVFSSLPQGEAEMFGFGLSHLPSAQLLKLRLSH